MIDWMQITLNLRTELGSLSKVARVLNVSHSGLRDLSLGRHKSPRFDTGVKLLNLHLDKCPTKHKPSIIGKP